MNVNNLNFTLESVLFGGGGGFANNQTQGLVHARHNLPLSYTTSPKAF